MAHEDDRSVAELLKQLSEQTQTLVRDEIQLALLELKDRGKKAGIGAGLFGASGMIALFGVATLIAAVVLALATAVDAWLAALIVAVVLLGTAAVLALTGKRELEGATPPLPQEAIDSTKEDVEAVKEHVAHRGDPDAGRRSETTVSR
ncbi:phage holin family protein [soil metagenome]|jgi:uncharacterized membrane protein YqjE